VPVLLPPVDAPVVRAFHYAGSPFARGLHRGVDLGAPPGARASAPCAGVVAWAGPRAVTVACGRWRVTLLPVAAVRVRAGDRVRAGAVVASVGAAGRHRGLHLGVRRAGDPFGYVDPAPLLRRVAAPPPLGVAPPPGVRPSGPAPGPSAPAPAPVADRPAPVAPPAASAPPADAPVAAWAGLALAATAAAGSARRRRRRRLRRHARLALGTAARET
jgi:Peptidase family M23